MFKLMESKMVILLIYTISSRKMYKKVPEFMEGQFKFLPTLMESTLNT